MNDCPELERTHALADGELAAEEADQARDHLATCAACQAELADLVQLELAVAEVPRPAIAAAPEHVAPITDLAWYRRRKVQIAGVALAAAASVAIYVAVGRRTGTTAGEPRPVALALASQRVIEARVSWGEPSRHRDYGVMRAGEAPHENVPLTALAELEQRGDAHGIGVLALLNGDRAQAAKYLERSGETADVLADRAALALGDGQPERALVLADAALGKTPGHTAATWNRALALRDLGLGRAAAEAFRAVAAKGEPGWAAEATQRAAALTAETDARRDLTNRVYAAMRTLAADGTGLAAADVQKLPGLSQLVLYDAMRAARTPAQLAALRPLFESLGSDARATLARAVPRPAIAETYAAIIAGRPPTGPARAQYLAALRAAHADEHLIGALVKLAPVGYPVAPDELPELARLAAASPDVWFRLIGLEQQAQVALAKDDLVTAEAFLVRAKAACDGSAPAYRCIKIETLLADVYTQWQRIPEARGAVTQAWARARRDNEWYSEIQLLQRFITIGVLGDDLGTGLPMVNAYAEELRLRWPDNCPTVAWTRVMTAMALVDQLAVPAAARELAAAPACDGRIEPAAMAQQLFVRAHVVRERGTAAELAALRAEIAKLRADPATPLTLRLVADHSEGRALIDRDPAAGEALLRRVIAGARSAPAADATARKAAAFSYSVLAIDAARRGDGKAALAVLAEEQGLEPPGSCVVGLAIDDQRRIAVARDAAGAYRVHYDEERKTAALDPAAIVPAEITAAIAGCGVVDVIARAPIHGTPRLFAEAIAWRYLSPRAHAPGPASDREVVVADVEPPAGLGLARLGAWSAPRGDRLSGPSATPARVLAAISDAGVVTVHAHGLVDLGRSDASFLALSPDGDGRYALTAGEVRAARFRASPLVILAACRASQATPVLHEPWSLPAAFVYAGARGVIASASPIPDADASAFFDDVRARVSTGAPVATALRDARRTWLDQHRGDWVRDVLVFE